MKRTFQTLVASFAIAALALGSTASVLTLVSADAAYAKNGNGNAGGNGGGKGKSAAAKSKGGASSAGKSKKSKHSARVAATPELNATGSVASQLKWLNAAHASLNAYAHANPNSQVGRIATYRQALLDYDAAATDPEAQASLDAYRDALAGLAAEGTATEDIDAALAELQGLDGYGTFTDEELSQALRDRYPDATDEEIAAATEELSGVVESDNELQNLAAARDAALDAATRGIDLAVDSDAWTRFHHLLRLTEPLPTSGEDLTEESESAELN